MAIFDESFHTHTWRCNHATDKERDYVERALADGMKVLGFSDHSPYVFDGQHYSSFRMRPEQADDYFDTIEALQAEYKGRIELHAGYEAEYYPRFFAQYEKLIAKRPPEYLLLGQHFLYNEVEGIGSMRETTDDALLIQYVNQVCEALNTGLFACVAHPDCIHYVGSPLVYEREMTRFCESALKNNVPLEINLLGLRTNRHYPNPTFWPIVGKVGNTVVCGSDAHEACAVCDKASFAQAMDIVRQNDLKWRSASCILSGGHLLR